jgi:hypothetical protein
LKKNISPGPIDLDFVFDDGTLNGTLYPLYV